VEQRARVGYARPLHKVDACKLRGAFARENVGMRKVAKWVAQAHVVGDHRTGTGTDTAVQWCFGPPYGMLAAL
jgi:hypothetical protein